MTSTERDPGQALERLRRQKATLVAFGRLALQDVPMDVLLQEAARGASDGTGIGHTKILVYEAGHGDFIIRAGVRWGDDVVGKLRAPASERSPPGRTFQTGQPVIVEDLPNNPNFDAHEPLKSHHIVSLVNVPISNDAIYGVLEIDAAEKVTLGTDDIDFLFGFANLIAAAIEPKNAESAGRIAAAALAKAAAERQVFLQEIQHRVANNFQVLVGAMSLVYGQTSSEDVKETLRGLIERADGMAQAHRQLSAIHGPQTVQVGSCLTSLCFNLVTPVPRVRLETDIREAEMPLDRALGIGLVLNEIITNALKHAFPGEATGTIRVEFTPAPERSEAALVVVDTGRSMGPPRQGGSGLGLMATLADQLDGQMERSANPGGGMRHEFRFPFAKRT
jgi:two-component sensor histidine kinase